MHWSSFRWRAGGSYFIAQINNSFVSLTRTQFFSLLFPPYYIHMSISLLILFTLSFACLCLSLLLPLDWTEMICTHWSLSHGDYLNTIIIRLILSLEIYQQLNTLLPITVLPRISRINESRVIWVNICTIMSSRFHHCVVCHVACVCALWCTFTCFVSQVRLMRLHVWGHRT